MPPSAGAHPTSLVSVKRALICIPAPSRLQCVLVALVPEILPLALSHPHRQDPLRHAQTARYFFDARAHVHAGLGQDRHADTGVVMVWRRWDASCSCCCYCQHNLKSPASFLAESYVCRQHCHWRSCYRGSSDSSSRIAGASMGFKLSVNYVLLPMG
jgi:hypothetical protein